VGYLTYGTDAANMLFHVVNERHRRHRPMIFTTNKSLKAWGRVLHDEDLAQAIIDRVLERGRLLRLDGPSVRTLHVNLDEALTEDSDQQADLIRISGKRWSEFPEPSSSCEAINLAVLLGAQRFRAASALEPTQGHFSWPRTHSRATTWTELVAQNRRASPDGALGRRGRWFESSRPRPLF